MSSLLHALRALYSPKESTEMMPKFTCNKNTCSFVVLTVKILEFNDER